MTAAALLADLASRGVRVTIEEGGQVVLDGPRAVLTPGFIETVRVHKPQLLQLLAARPVVMTAAECGWCRSVLAPYLFDLAARPALLCTACKRWTVVGGPA